jgi:hypothetical protein
MPMTAPEFDIRIDRETGIAVTLAKATNIALQRLRRLWYVANVFRSHPIRRASIRCLVEGGNVT